MLYVTQLGSEPGTDMAWCGWLVLEHEVDNTADTKNWRPLDNLFSEVDLDFEAWQEQQENAPTDKLFERWLAEVKPEIERRGFKVIGDAQYIFNSMQK